jgi:hypothetical protein
VVLRVNQLELRQSEMASLCADIAELYPEYSPLHVRRLALTNEFLPRLAVGSAHAAARADARARCEAVLDGGSQPVEIEGTFHGLGLSVWSAARHLTVGQWSETLELVGRFVRVRLEERTSNADPREEHLRVSVHVVPYLEPESAAAEVEAAIDAAQLELLDADFAQAVPEFWKHRMHVRSP